MTPQIQQRIDQLRRSEMPDGYKTTKSGIIPHEWSSYTLGDIYTERKESGIPSLPILTVSIHSGVSDGALDDDELGKKVKRIEDKTQYRTAHSGDLVFNMMRAWQGAIGVVRSDGLVSPAYIVATPDESVVYPPFMDYFMKTPQMINKLHRKSYGVTDFRLRLYWDSFAMIDCALPPLHEQKKIAEILSAQDKLIALTEKLIEEKKRQKKYLMQQLLTGKMRLPGFNEEWARLRLKDIAVYITERKVMSQNVYLSTENIKPDYLGVEFTAGQDNMEGIHYKEDDILISNIRPYLKKVWLSNQTGVCSADILVLRAQNFLPMYLYYIIARDAFVEYVMNGVKGTKMPRGDKQHIMQMEVCSPSLSEQNAIVNFLSNIDRELVLLNRNLDQEKQKKKALMQLLLSGVVRV